MSNETMVTLQGWIGSTPVGRDVGEASVTSFRLACTPRRFHRGRQEWVDGETQWYTVNAWRALAGHSLRSLNKGDPVLVHGRLTHRTYVNKSEVEVVSLEVEATTIGHDLTRGCSQFLKSPPRETGDTRPDVAERAA
ncbi:single-stranded DNA-binding protein [Nocardioides sambongensis]|uniref:single-stranded DNA-binding protein n=1 Tax=Nocardioides sambongensis TaxID=2589074 RepID=UPI0011261A84|nr:single-stranded DNA-binding protein [Nocardioides sambongensis]